jgi:hypothetical protein
MTVRELLTLTLEVLTSSSYLACKRRAVLGAETEAELDSLPIKAVSYSYDGNSKRYRFTHPKSYRIGCVSNTIQSNYDRILIEIESKSDHIVRNTESGKVICAYF